MTITVAAARTLLAAEGNTPENVETAIESLLHAGLDIPAYLQPDGTSDDLLLTPEEVVVLREQLAEWAAQPSA